jgi:hypothetical protein
VAGRLVLDADPQVVGELRELVEGGGHPDERELALDHVEVELPPRVEYELTDLGRSLQYVALALADWVREHQQTIASNRRDFDGDA